MAEQAIDRPGDSHAFLDRTVNLTAVSWTAIGWVVTIVVAAVLRLAQLGHFPLSAREARVAHEAWRFVTGGTAGDGNAIGNVGPTTRMLTAVAIFLFGESDSAVRFVPALLGIVMVGAIFLLRGVAGKPQSLGMAALVTISPALVFASRTLSEEIVVASFAFVTLVALLRAGEDAISPSARTGWAIASGVALAATFGGGASSLSVLATMLLAATVATALDPRPSNAFKRSLAALSGTREASVGLLMGFAVTTVTLFSRFFTDFSALAGIAETFADWGRLLTTASANTPTQFFLLVVLLYEFLAVAFAIVAATRSTDVENGPSLPWTFFAIWFAGSLLVFSFSSGGQPVHAVHVVLPIVLLGGSAIGEVVGRVWTSEFDRQRLGLLTLAMVGVVISVFAALVLLGRIDDAVDQSQALFEAGATIVLAVGPLAFAVATMIRADRRAGKPSMAMVAALLALLTVFGAVTFRTTVLLSFYNADEPIELIAQETSTGSVDRVITRITNLGRDTTLREGSARDPEGGRGLTIAIDQRVAYPYRWYLRDFPDMAVLPAGQATLTGAQVVIAPDDEGMADTGYSATLFPTKNRVPSTYLAPNFGDVIRGIVLPSRWEESARYLLFRTMTVTAEPETVTVGLTGELSNQIEPNTGPFGLFERVGSGAGRGQFNQPRGIAVDPLTGDIYVVDMGNARVQRFDGSGQVIDVWGSGETVDPGLLRTNEGLGPTGIAVADDGLIYVCDTWNHRIVVLDESGHLVREFGTFGNTEDSPDPSIQTGTFFGPRGIAIYNDELYVVDTGNERVQVFALDGTFLRTWGGHGSEPNHLIEPVGIAIDDQGLVYVADSSNARISIFTGTGAPVNQWPVDAWAQNLYFEPYLAFDAAGHLYASSSATGSVEVFSQDGIVLLTVSEVGGETLEQPTGLAWSPDGSMLITDKGRSAVFRYVPPVIDDPAAVVDTGDENDESGATESTPAVETESEIESSPAGEAAALSDASPVAAASPIASPVASPVASPASP